MTERIPASNFEIWIMTSTLLEYLPNLPLQRLEDETEAGLWLASLPWPRAPQLELALDSQPAFALPLGHWPGEPQGTPRRLLLAADGGNRAPAAITVTGEAEAATTAVSAQERSPRAATRGAAMELFESSPHSEYVWERHLLRLSYGDKSIGFAMGLKTGGDIHWWEACRLVVKGQSDECLVVEMGGAIPHGQMEFEDFKKFPGVTNPYLHKHNWLSGHIYARFHSNGVCEVFAHHVNSKFFDDGLDLKDAVPVIGIASDAVDPAVTELCGAWDGTKGDLQLGAARFDLREVARLATLEQPGHISAHGVFVVLQPYAGMELFGGLCPAQLIDDEFIFRAEEHLIPRGMARTLRFSFSLSDRSPRVARYQAPAWWYGACEEFLPEPLLPVANEYDAGNADAVRWVLDSIVTGGFEDGSIPRHANRPRDGEEAGRSEPGWEGEIPYALFLRAWRSADGAEYAAAMRAAYYFTDVCVDHAAKAVRMHGYPPNAFSVPMNRMQASIAAYLETGDEYLLEAAKAVTANSYWTHVNSWPRLAVGRDACFIRSAVLLYRYFGTDFYREIAYQAARNVVESQRSNGSFGDQGGGAGIHQWGGYISKPWMGLLALGGVLDYLELFPDERLLLEGVRRFADWLMAERHECDGILGWSYQHDFNGTRRFYNPTSATHTELPGQKLWHQETFGRLLTFCSIRFSDPAYFDAWVQNRTGRVERGDHGVSAALQFVPWVQAKLWGATLSESGAGNPIHVCPLDFGERTPRRGCAMTPDGMRELRRTGNQTAANGSDRHYSIRAASCGQPV